MIEPDEIITEEDITTEEETIIEETEPIKVYAQTNDQSHVIDINSSVFLSNPASWTQIDEGYGDRYAHAQNQYLEKGLMDENGCYNYALVDGVLIERTAEEKQAEIDARPEPEPSETEILSQQVTTLTEDIEAVAETTAYNLEDTTVIAETIAYSLEDTTAIAETLAMALLEIESLKAEIAALKGE